MDRQLHALVTRDVLTETVRIDVQGSLNEESRPTLVHLMTRVRSMGISSHVLVDLSNAALIESAALAGLRNDLNAMDQAAGQEMAGAGVSLVLTSTTDAPLPAPGIGGQSLVITDELTDELLGWPALDPDGAPTGASAFAAVTPASDAMFGRPLAEYTDDELFAASDAAFALLDNPEASGGSDLLARYNDIGAEISRRTLVGGLDGPAGEGSVEPAGEGRIAS